MKCYHVTLKPTNAVGNAAMINGLYYEVSHGKIYVFATDISEAAKQIPGALSIDEVGPAYVPTMPQEGQPLHAPENIVGGDE